MIKHHQARQPSASLPVNHAEVLNCREVCDTDGYCDPSVHTRFSVNVSLNGYAPYDAEHAQTRRGR